MAWATVLPHPPFTPPTLPPLPPPPQICDALNRRRNRKGQRLRHPPSAYVTGLLVPRGGSIKVDHQALALLGIRHVMEVDSFTDPDGGGAALFEPAALVQAIEKMIAVLNSGDSQETLTSLGVTI